MRSDFGHYIRIVRPLNVAIGVLAIFVGALVTGKVSTFDVMLACVSGGMVMAGGNVINDYFDIQIDSINKPHRSLPLQALSPQAAFLWAAILFLSGIFLSIFISLLAFSICLLISFGLFVYSAILKRTLFWGNFAVSLFSGMAFIYGGIAAGHWRPALFPAGFAFLFHLGREIIKDIEDREADAALQAKTLPIVLGNRTALQIASAILTGLILFTLLPYALGIYGELYFWVVVLGVDCVIVISLIMLWRNPVPIQFRKVSMVFKLDMIIGLLAIYSGSQGA